MRNMKKKLLTSLTLLAFTLVLIVVSCGSKGTDSAGTASEVITTASILGTLVNGSELQTQSMKVELYLIDSGNTTALLKTTSSDSLIGSLTTSSGLFQFTNLPAGSYRIAVINDSVSVGGMDGIVLSTGQALQITIEITIIIQQNITINTTNNISIQNIIVESGVVEKNADGSYRFLIPEDSANVAVTVIVDDNGNSKTVEANLVKQDDGSYVLVLPDDSDLEAATTALSSSSIFASSSSSSTSDEFVTTIGTGWCASIGNCGTFLDVRDKKQYKWTKIGEQIWMAENLAYLPSVSTSSDSSTLTSKYYVLNYSGNDTAEAKATSVYGTLFNFSAALTACPAGWHLPDTTEWKVLQNYVGGISKAGQKLKSQTGWKYYDGVVNEDAFGFAGLPSGSIIKTSTNLGYADFWTSIEETDSTALNRSMYAMFAYMADYSSVKSNGFAIRCIRN